MEKKISQGALAEIVGVSRNTISSIETGQYSPTAKLAYAICLALDQKFEDVFYFQSDPTVKAELPAPMPSSDEEDDGNRCEASLSDRAYQRIITYLKEQNWSAGQILDFILYLTRE